MTVTRDVVLDLLPLYQAGEASADTRALVDAFLAGDPQLARLAAAGPVDAALRSGVVSATEVERRTAMERTRQLIARRQVFLAGAIALTLFPFAFTFAGGDIVWAMMRDDVGMGVGLLGGAVVCWVNYVRLRNQLRATGV